MPRCAARPVVQLQHRSSSCRCHRRHEADASTAAECARAARVCIPQVWPVGLRSSTSGSSWERTSSFTGKEQLDSSLRMPQVSGASTVLAASCMDCYAGCSPAQIAITPPCPRTQAVVRPARDLRGRLRRRAAAGAAGGVPAVLLGRSVRHRDPRPLAPQAPQGALACARGPLYRLRMRPISKQTGVLRTASSDAAVCLL